MQRNLKSHFVTFQSQHTFVCCAFRFFYMEHRSSKTKHNLALNSYFHAFNIWEIRTAAGTHPALRREQLITPKSLLSTACGRSWTELYCNKGRNKQCQISSAAITMIGPESRDWPPTRRDASWCGHREKDVHLEEPRVTVGPRKQLSLSFGL